MRRPLLIVLIASLAQVGLLNQGKRVTVTFAPQGNNQVFQPAAEEYRSIWAAEGARIIAGMEKISRLKFPHKDIDVEIYEGTSFSGRGNAPMRLRASYPADEKKGTLVHELGHRMDAQLMKRPQDLDEHRLLFLYLYDLYVDLFGKEFADRQVQFERTLKGMYDYDGAWTWTLAMSREERSARFAEVLRLNRK
jgi:hypothetical protein